MSNLKFLFEGSTGMDQDNWDDLMDDLTLAMKGHRRWRVEVENFGWTNSHGTGEFEVNGGEELLRRILPHTDCSFKVYRVGKSHTLKIDNAHHDKPTGGEWYTITPM